MATYYVDFDGGNDANDGLSFANRKRTITSIATLNPFDVVRVKESASPTALGTASWTNLSKTVTIPSGLTANVDQGESAWTASANVTATTSTTRKQGSTSSSLAIAAGFTTGLVAYKAFSATDFSAFKQLSWFMRANAAIASGVFELRLCSDALGVTAVDTFAVPANPNSNNWCAYVSDKAAALGASIQSIALYALSDPGTVTILIDNVIACKDSTSADSIDLTKLIGKNTAGETWFAIQSIDGTTVLIDQGPNAQATVGQGYTGVTESVATSIRKPAMLPLSATRHLDVNGSGAGVFLVYILCGYDRTAMTSVTSETWVSGGDGGANGLTTIARDLIAVDKLHCVNFNIGFNLSGAGSNLFLSNCSANNNQSVGIQTSSTSFKVQLDNVRANNNTGGGLSLSGGNIYNNLGTTLKTDGNTGFGISSAARSLLFYNYTSRNNSSSGFFNGGCDFKVYNYVSAHNSNGILTRGPNVYLINASISEATEVSADQNFGDYKVFSHKHGGTTDNHKIYTDGGMISSETGADRRTLSGMAWKFSPTSANRSTTYPLSMGGAKVACRANKLVTVKVWAKRDNASVTARLMVKGGQINGVAADVSASTAGAVGSYEELTITFTPTEVGVVDINLEAFGSTTFNAWFDDMLISQAV